MRTKDWTYFKKILLNRRDEVILELRKYAESGNDLHGNENKYCSHMADTGSDTHQNELNWYSAHRQKKYLQHIERALERIEKGQYGICIECCKEIPRNRLRVVPHSQYCVSCKS